MDDKYKIILATPNLDENYLLKNFDTTNSEPVNQSSIKCTKSVSQRIRYLPLIGIKVWAPV